MAFDTCRGCGNVHISIVDLKLGGIGHHRDYVAATNPSKLVTWAKLSLVGPMLHATSVVIPRLSILMLYLRVFPQRRDRVICYVTAALILANFVGVMVAGFVICIPLNALWNPKIQGRCIDKNAWYRWATLMNIVTDIIMLVVPLPVIWKIKCSTRTKIGLTITFGVGSV